MRTQHFHSPRGCLSFITYDPVSKQAALIDPSSEIATETYLNYLQDNGLSLKYIIETHTHADHISSAKELKQKTDASIVRHELAPSKAKDIIVHGGEELPLGQVFLKVLGTPGHTNESISLYNGSEVFTGDALLIGGTGRTDFQVGDSETLYQSLHFVIASLPGETIVRPGHDYKERNQSVLQEELHTNPRLALCESEFIATMDAHHPEKPELFEESIRKNSQ
jgi:glyoxylase-like metal-dependent hydrolase (beta-lactamase superfamily II)